MTSQDEQLLLMAKDGQPAAVEALYREYFGAIYRFCYWQTNQSADAEDLTQEIFIEMAKSIRNFQARSSFKNWLYTIAKRRISSWIREKYNYPKVELLEAIPDDENWIDPENEALKEQAVQKLLNKLSPIEKSAMELRYLQNCTVKETAEKLGITEANVKVVCHRSLKKLKEKLKL